MFNLREIIPINFYIEAYGKYTYSIIIWILTIFEAKSFGRQPNIIVLIDISLFCFEFYHWKTEKTAYF